MPFSFQRIDRPWLFVLAIVVFVLAGVVLFMEDRARPLAAVGLVICSYLINKSRGQRTSATTDTQEQNVIHKPRNRPGRLTWALVATSLFAMAVSSYLLYWDSIHGSEQVWPVYLFAGVWLVFGAILVGVVVSVTVT